MWATCFRHSLHRLRHYKPSPSLPYSDGSPGVPPDLQCLLPKELSGPARTPDQPAWPGYYPSPPGHLRPRAFSIQDSTRIVPQHRSLYRCHQPRDNHIGPLGSVRHYYASPRTAPSGLHRVQPDLPHSGPRPGPAAARSPTRTNLVLPWQPVHMAILEMS